jgi:hypothetical protein
MNRKAYIGDGVYIDVDPHGAYVLTTENGVCATNTIVLEREVAMALLDYLVEDELGRRMVERAAQRSNLK